MVENKVREIITPQARNKMFKLDFSEWPDNKELNYSEDQKFLKIVTEGMQHTQDGRYEIPLPLCRDDVRFPENKEQVLQRAHWLRKKLVNNEIFYKDYVNFMNSIIVKGSLQRLQCWLDYSMEAKSSGSIPYRWHMGAPDSL